MLIEPNTSVRFHGGWNHAGVRCHICNFPCDFIFDGIVVEPYQLWDTDHDRSILHPDNLWVVKLSTGGYAVGYESQIYGI